MKLIRPALLLVLAIALLSPSLRGAVLDHRSVCAVVEVDNGGRLWINGHAGRLDGPAIHQCVENEIVVVVPEFWAPADAFIKTMVHLQDHGRTVKVLMPSFRREVNYLFGMDTLLKCQQFSEHEIQPLPPQSEVTGREAIRVVRSPVGPEGSPTVAALEMAPRMGIGVADEVAAAHGAYRQRGGVQFVVTDEDERLVVRLAELDWWVPPPPKLEKRIVDGVEQWPSVSDRELCIYPNGI